MGGEARRLGGRSKADLLLDGVPLLKVVRGRVAAVGLFSEIFTVGRGGDVADAARFFGPAAGVVAACRYAKSGWLFICACDMPFLNGQLVRALLQEAGNAPGVLPRWKAGYEPLFVWMRAGVVDRLEKALAKNNMRLAPAMLDCGFVVVEEPVLRQHDPQLLSFFNINSHADLEEACRIAKAQGTKNAATA